VNIALFDFDGTVTFKDTFSDFIHFAVDSKRRVAGTLLLSPLIAGYKLGVVPGSRIRESIARFGFRGGKEAELRQIGSKYANQVIPKLVRPEALSRIRWHKSQGDAVVIVSASLEIYLSDWCKKLEVDLISTQLEVKTGALTGRYCRGDCSGNEKRRRILEKYKIDEYAVVYAYGDTYEDKEMLSMANRRYFRWKELTE